MLWLANLYYGAIRCGRPMGFCTIQVRLMDLRDWVRDYRPALEHFFEIKQLGFRFDDENQEFSTLSPRLLSAHELNNIEDVAEGLTYTPPAIPDGTIISKVYLQPGLNRRELVERCLTSGRPEIVPQLNWLLQQPPELNFHFVRSGKLKLRDTSVWPISAIETWPHWLREKIFGPGIDLDSAYVQFLLQHLRQTYKNQEHLIDLLFPDLLKLLNDKESFRKELCTQVLQRPYNDKYKSVIKQVLMSLANGSRISPALLLGGTGFSSTADLILDAAPDASTSELTTIGARLQLIASQFNSARKHACLRMRHAPNRANIKKVFSSYFEWERQARYALWTEIDQHGIMVHDGLDGIPQRYLDRLPEIMKTLGLRLTT